MASEQQNVGQFPPIVRRKQTADKPPGEIVGRTIYRDGVPTTPANRTVTPAESITAPNTQESASELGIEQEALIGQVSKEGIGERSERGNQAGAAETLAEYVPRPSDFERDQPNDELLEPFVNYRSGTLKAPSVDLPIVADNRLATANQTVDANPSHAASANNSVESSGTATTADNVELHSDGHRAHHGGGWGTGWPPKTPDGLTYAADSQIAGMLLRQRVPVTPDECRDVIARQIWIAKHAKSFRQSSIAAKNVLTGVAINQKDEQFAAESADGAPVTINLIAVARETRSQLNNDPRYLTFLRDSVTTNSVASAEAT